MYKVLGGKKSCSFHKSQCDPKKKQFPLQQKQVINTPKLNNAIIKLKFTFHFFFECKNLLDSNAVAIFLSRANGKICWFQVTRLRKINLCTRAVTKHLITALATTWQQTIEQNRSFHLSPELQTLLSHCGPFLQQGKAKRRFQWRYFGTEGS